MAPLVYKTLIHEENIIRYNAIFPLEQLSEDSQVCGNNDYEECTLYHSSKCSRSAPNYDVFHFLLCTSDLFIRSIRKKLSEEVVDSKKKLRLHWMNKILIYFLK